MKVLTFLSEENRTELKVSLRDLFNQQSKFPENNLDRNIWKTERLLNLYRFGKYISLSQTFFIEFRPKFDFILITRITAYLLVETMPAWVLIGELYDYCFFFTMSKSLLPRK